MIKLIIYLEKITPRIRYIFDLIFNDIIKIEYQLITNANLYKTSTYAKINYSKVSNLPGINVTPNSLLFENTIEKKYLDELSISEWENVPVFFQTSSKDIPFDIFAASFFLVSRYEEYLPFEPDRHGRFYFKNSVSYKKNILKYPLINIWAQKFSRLIFKDFPNLMPDKTKFEILPTFDIDNPYAYLHKGVGRIVGGLAKSTLKGDIGNVVERVKVHSRLKPDPYDTYSYLDSIYRKEHLKPLYFIPVADYGKYDKNLSPNNKNYIKLIKEIAAKYDLGLHPGYKAADNYDLFKEELERLEDITERRITRSRQHFVRLDFPEYYNKLEGLGIEEDYTMGYAAHSGFRAGICTPFYFFDLLANVKKQVKIYPFALMDVTLNSYMGLSPDEAIIESKETIELIKKTGGLFVSLWHNESFCEKNHWKGWRKVYNDVLKFAI